MGATENLKPFKPGQSGNPGGRPKGLAKAARELLGNDPKRLLQVLLTIAEDEKATRNERINAAKEILDRGWGKAPSHAPVEDGDPLELGDTGQRIADILDELAPRRSARAAGSPEASSVDLRSNGVRRETA